MTPALRFLFLLILVVGPALAAWAHPHVFIKAKASFLFDGTTLTGVREEWLFDEVYGSALILDYDRNKDRKFSEAETKAVKSEAFDNLANYGYFTQLSVDGIVRRDLKISDFAVTVVGNTVLYAFTVALDVSQSAKTKAIRLTMYDNEYFVAFDPIRSADIRVSPATSWAQVSVGKAKAQEMYPGQGMPDQVLLNLAAKQ